MTTEWYVVDRRSKTIVNCITTNGEKPERVLAVFIDAEHLYLDSNPPMSMLEKYRYWNERP